MIGIGFIGFARIAVIAFALSTEAAGEGAPRPTPRSQTLFLSLQLDRLSGAADGGGATADWLLSSGGRKLTLGIAHNDIGGARWSYGKAAALVEPRDGTFLHAEVRLGPGTRDGHDFTFQIVRAGVALELIPARLALNLEDQLLDVDTLRGNLAVASLSWVLTPRVQTELAYRRSTSGNLDSSLLTARVELPRRRLGYTAGATVGRSRSLLERAELLRARDASYVELFGGLKLTLRGKHLTLILSTLDWAQTRRSSLILSLKLPSSTSSGPSAR